MKTIQIYEPAMCCDTGLCGVGIDPELMRMSTVLDNLKKNGIIVNRYNLSSAPQQFINNKEVNRLLNEKGPEILPITMIDDKVELTGKYPTNGEIIMLLNISPDFLDSPKKSDDKCCGGSKNKNGGCC